MVKQKHESLAAALAAFQGALPKVAKNATGQVGQNRNYKYADLADVTDAAFPKLAEHGLSFISKPTLNANGVFVLAYSLLHESGGREDGEFVLPTEGTMQQLGSACTYSRRYSLCAVTGIVPDEDDDGQSAAEYRARPPQQRSNGQQQRPAAAAQEAAADPTSPAEEARADLRAKVKAANIDGKALADRFLQQYGEELATCTDATRITAFAKLQNLSASSRVAANGATR